MANFSLSGWLSVPVPWTRGSQRWRRPSYCIVFELKFDMRGGGVLLLTSQHLPQHHLPALVEKEGAFISGNSSAPSTGSVASVEEDCKHLPTPIFFCQKVSFF